MSFAPGFTPTLLLSIPADTEDLTAVSDLTVTLECAGRKINKKAPDVLVTSSTEAEVTLTQEETLSMWGNVVRIQLNWLYPGTALRWGTDPPAEITLDEQLLREVLTGGA